MPKHLSTECNKVEIKCEKCDQLDFRIRFKDGKHDCISLLKDAINQMQASAEREEIQAQSTSRLRSGDHRPRAFDEY